MPIPTAGSARVRVYWHSQKKCFSVLDRSRRLWRHADVVDLVDVKFVVREAGRRKALKTGVKNVHAYAEGVLTARDPSQYAPTRCRSVTYNPFLTEGFVFEDDGSRADRVALLLCRVLGGRAALLVPASTSVSIAS